MNSQKLYSHIDRELEKQVFLFNIEEGLYGLWELVQIVNHYQFLTLVDKHAIAYDLLKEILSEDLAKLEEFTDSRLITKVRYVDLVETNSILDNPRSWDLSGEPFYSLSITSKGHSYLDNLDEEKLNRLHNKIFKAG
jgi:hypothetical protein